MIILKIPSFLNNLWKHKLFRMDTDVLSLYFMYALLCLSWMIFFLFDSIINLGENTFFNSISGLTTSCLFMTLIFLINRMCLYVDENEIVVIVQKDDKREFLLHGCYVILFRTKKNIFKYEMRTSQHKNENTKVFFEKRNDWYEPKDITFIEVTVAMKDTIAAAEYLSFYSEYNVSLKKILTRIMNKDKFIDSPKELLLSAFPPNLFDVDIQTNVYHLDCP